MINTQDFSIPIASPIIPRPLVFSGALLGWSACFALLLGGWSWASAKLELSVESPRRAFYRGETIVLIVKIANVSDRTVSNATLDVELAGCVRETVTLRSIEGGQQHRQTVRLPTRAIASGPYQLRISLGSRDGRQTQPARPAADAAAIVEPMVIGAQPLPDQLQVWLWGGSGGAWYLDHGFTTWNGPPRAMVDQRDYDQARTVLDQALSRGATVGIRPNGGLRDIDPNSIADPDATNLAVRETSKGKIANPFHPEVARLQNAANRRLMEFVQEYPQVKTAFFNTEVVDQLGTNRNRAGLERIQQVLGPAADERGPPKFVAPGVIADDDGQYLLHKFQYQSGNGLALANQRTADMVHHYRPDILTINDPYRYTSLLDMFPGIDVVSTWTYTKPDPKLMLAIETLRAACKPTGQIALHTITMLNYPGSIAPTKEWMLMGPGRVAVTSWINLSRAPKMMGYYYSSACAPPGKLGDFRVPYESSLKIKQLAELVYRPYGPLITQLDNAPRRIAVLSSAASIVHRAQRPLYGYGNMQIYPFYTVMAMAHLQADVVFDETIERYGLDDYDVLVLPQCDTLTQSVYRCVRQFRKRGGTVIADQYLRARIPGAIKFDFDFTYRRKVSADAIVKNETYAQWNDLLKPQSAQMQRVEGITAADDQKFLESYAAELKQKLARRIDRNVDCDTPKVLVNMLEKEGVQYLVLINDNRTYDDRVGEFKAVLGKLLPQSTTITIKTWDHAELFAYDLLERQPLAVTKRAGIYEFPVQLTELGGKIIALYPQPLKSLRIETAPTIRRGDSAVIKITLQDDAGALLPGYQPLRVAITDAAGDGNDFQGYYCAKRGLLEIDFVAACNDAPGTWTISAEDLTSGLTATTVLEVIK